MESPVVATEIATGRRTKKETGLKRDWESPPQLFWKTMENNENKTSL